MSEHGEPSYSAVLDLPAPETIEQAVRERNGWIDSVAMFHRNEQWYRGLLVEIGEMFGDEARTSDDGSVQDSVLVSKVPELVRGLIKQRAN